MTSLYNFLRWYFVLEDFPSSKKEDIRNHLLSVRKIFLALTIICFACCLCLLIYSWKAALTFLFIGNLFIACICLYGFSSRLRQIGLSFDMKTAEIQKLRPKIFFKRVYHEAVTTFLLFLIVFWPYWGLRGFLKKVKNYFPHCYQVNLSCLQF